MILMIDNYDSFTYNLVQYLGQLGADVEVRRNDEIGLDEIGEMAPGGNLSLARSLHAPRGGDHGGRDQDIFTGTVPIMGVCLGHQAIGAAFGAEVVRAPRIMHGKTSSVRSDGRTIFRGLPNPFTAGRYHSLIVDRSTLPPCLEVSAETDEGEIMGLRHRDYPGGGDPVSSGIDPDAQRENGSSTIFLDLIGSGNGRRRADSNDQGSNRQGRRGQRPTEAEMMERHGRDHGGSGHARPDRCLHHRPADQGGDRRRGHRRRPGHAAEGRRGSMPGRR